MAHANKTMLNKVPIFHLYYWTKKLQTFYVITFINISMIYWKVMLKFQGNAQFQDTVHLLEISVLFIHALWDITINVHDAYCVLLQCLLSSVIMFNDEIAKKIYWLGTTDSGKFAFTVILEVLMQGNKLFTLQACLVSLKTRIIYVLFLKWRWKVHLHLISHTCPS